MNSPPIEVRARAIAEHVDGRMERSDYKSGKLGARWMSDQLCELVCSNCGKPHELIGRPEHVWCNGAFVAAVTRAESMRPKTEPVKKEKPPGPPDPPAGAFERKGYA